MKNKIMALAAALMVFGVANTFALGIGVQGGLGVGSKTTGGPGLTLKLDQLPWVFAGNASFGDGLGIGVTADMWLANPNLVAFLNGYFGWGVAGTVYLSDSKVSIGAGGRLLAGLNAKFFNDFLEAYLQIAWQPGATFNLAEGEDLIGANIFYIPANIGVRLWC